MTTGIATGLRVVPMILIMGTIFFLSHQSGDELALPSFYGSDKLAHIIAYATLGAAVHFALSPEFRHRCRGKSISITILISLAYGLLDEFHQSFVPGRDVSSGDVLADVIGAALGVCLFLYVHHRRRSRAVLRQLAEKEKS